MISKYINNFGVACESLHGTPSKIDYFGNYFFLIPIYRNFSTGDKPQSQRTKILDDFRSGRSNIIVATDVAARGLGKKYFFLFFRI